MEVSTKLRFIRITPRKVGLLADQIRGKKINEALNYLQFSPRRRTAQVLRGILKNAIANAYQAQAVDGNALFVKQILVGRGPIMKRISPRAKGAAFRISKRTAHVSVTLAQR